MNFKQAKRNKKIDIWISLPLMFTLLLCVNYVISKIKYTVDLTEDSRFSLSTETLNKLSKITSPVDIIITISNNNNQPKIIQKLLHDLNLILNAFENSASNHPIKVHKINIDTAINNSEVIQKYKITERNQIIAITPSGNKKIIYKLTNLEETNVLDSNNIFRSKDSLAREKIWESGFYSNWKEVNKGVLEPSQFNGEKIILKSILDIAYKSVIRNTAYFTRGHGEGSPSDINSHKGFSELRNIFENQNINVLTIDLSTEERVPINAKYLVVMSPKGTFQPQELSLIRNFINSDGGRLLICLDPIEEISMIDRPALGFRELFKEWGIRCHDMLVYDPNMRNYDAFTGDYYLKTYNKKQSHGIINNLKEGQFIIQSTRMRPVEAIESDMGFISNELIYSSRDSWAISSWTNRKMPPDKNEILDLNGPIPIISCSEYKMNDLGNNAPKGKVVVIGSSKILTNKKLKENIGNKVICNNIISWLSDNNSFLEIESKNLNLYTISLNKDDLSSLFYSLTIVPTTIALLGFFVGWLRKEL